MKMTTKGASQTQTSYLHIEKDTPIKTLAKQLPLHRQSKVLACSIWFTLSG